MFYNIFVPNRGKILIEKLVVGNNEYKKVLVDLAKRSIMENYEGMTDSFIEEELDERLTKEELSERLGRYSRFFELYWLHLQKNTYNYCKNVLFKLQIIIDFLNRIKNNVLDEESIDNLIGFTSKTNEIITDFLNCNQLNKYFNDDKIEKLKKFNSQKNIDSIKNGLLFGFFQVKMFSTEGYYINNINENGNTALILAVNYGYQEIVKMLIKVGANLNIQNKDGNTALDIAKKNNNAEIINLLNNVNN